MTVTKPLTDETVIVNTVSVTSSQTSIPVTDTVATTVESVPAVQVVKNGPATANVGDTLVFTFTVANIGNSLLQVTDVVDNLATPVTFSGGDTNGNGWLELTESWIYTASYTVQPDDPALLVNTVTVTAEDGLNPPVSASAVHTTTSISSNPVLTITKTGPGSAMVGQTVVFTFEVQHAPTSDGSPVRSVLVSDDFAGLATLVSINGDEDEWLEFGETWRYTASYTIEPLTPNPFVNTGQVVARDQTDQVVSAATTHTMLLSGFEPVLFVDKEGPLTAGIGDEVEYSFVVVNYADITSLQLLGFDFITILAITPGDGSPINISQVTDTVAGNATYVGGDSNNNGVLDAAEAWNYTASHTISPSDPDPLPNTVTVLGTDQDGDALSATANHLTDIIYSPAVDIDVTTPASGEVGQTLDLSFAISHAAGSDNTPISNISFDDGLNGSAASLISGDANGNTMLDSAEEWVFTSSYTVQLSDPNPLTSMAAMQGLDIDNEVFTASQSFSVPIDDSGVIRLYLPIIVKRN